MTRLAGLGAALLVLLAFAGCGGDEHELSKDEFVDQANAVCTEGNEALDAAFSTAFPDGDPSDEDVKAFMDDTVLPGIRAQIDEIRALGSPDEIADDVESFLDGTDARLDEIGAMGAEELFALVTSGDDPFDALNDSAAELGLTECSS